MDEARLIRLEALRLAHERQGAADPRPILEIAHEYETWIAHGDKQTPPAAGPTATAPPAKR